MTEITIRQQILKEISQERDRQYNLPGSEYDLKHTVNDWVAIATQYLSRNATRKHQSISVDEQRDNFIKTAAIVLAAVEHLDITKK
jgi:hypothetical protein